MIRKLLTEIRNRDLNLQKVNIFLANSEDPESEYMVSFPSNDQPMAATAPLPLKVFCSVVSSASRFETIELLKKEEIKRVSRVNKRQEKA